MDGRKSGDQSAISVHRKMTELDTQREQCRQRGVQGREIFAGIHRDSLQWWNIYALIKARVCVRSVREKQRKWEARMIRL